MIRKLLYILFACSVFSAVGVVFSQTPNVTESGGNKTTENKGAEPHAADGSNEFISAVNVTDPRFRVTNLNFVRRYSPNGQGEFLDVVFEIKNQTLQPLSLYAYVLAFHETNAVNAKGRELIPYPSWRIDDPAKRTFLTYNMAITPADIKPEQVWDDADPDFQRTARIIKNIRASVATTEPVADSLPPFAKYLSYIMKHPEGGMAFQLAGPAFAENANRMQSNFVPQTDDEKKRNIFPNIANHKYTIYNNLLSSTVQSHHFSRFRPNYLFFNTVAILLFDAERAKGAAEQSKRQLKPGEEKIDPLVFKQIYQVERYLKVY